MNLLLDSSVMFLFISLKKSKARGELLFILHQGLHSAANYVLDIHTLDASIGWNAPVQVVADKMGLRADLVMELAVMKWSIYAH